VTATSPLQVADAAFVTDQLLVGGDLDTRDGELAGRQLRELVDAGVTHLVDTRIEWDDLAWVAERSPAVRYLHLGMDDAGQAVPAEWFDEAVGWALEAIETGGTVLTHCHMGINRGPSLGFAVLLAQGWDALEALERIREVRPIAFVAYAEDALRWHHAREGSPDVRLVSDLDRVARWRAQSHLDLEDVIRQKRQQGW
jgi:dual specificity phosphatase 3